MPRAWPLLLLILAVAATIPARADARASIKIRLPRIALPPQSNTEVCYYTRVDTTTPFSIGSWKIMHPGAKGSTLPQHGLVYVYTGEHLGELDPGKLVSSRGCLDVGPPDRDRRVLFASGASKSLVRKLPTGVALDLDPVPDAPGGPPAGVGILVDVNWVNADTRTRMVSTKVMLKRAPKKGVNRHARVFSDRSAEAGLFVPPFTETSTADLVDARWAPAADACLLGLSTQMHRRGRCGGVDLLDAADVVKAPAFGIVNPCEPDQRQQLFVGVDFTDPGSLALTTPLAVLAGESLRYACWTDNGIRKAVRLGCEETPGTTPGSVAGGPAALCTVAVPASPECPGNAACVAANAVAGPSVEDEVCGITGFAYDAAAGGGCDVSSAP